LGHAKDYLEVMYLILHHNKPEDFVLAPGITTTIRGFIKMAFDEIGFRGENEMEEGYVMSNDGYYKITPGKVVVKVDSKYYRPCEVDLLLGDASKAKNILGWIPKYDLISLV
jgi:GDPmannose 4,6-dehydratase